MAHIRIIKPYNDALLSHIFFFIFIFVVAATK